MNAMERLEKELRKNNIWKKMKAIYPLTGGYPNKTIFNLKDIPRIRRMGKIRKIFG